MNQTRSTTPIASATDDPPPRRSWRRNVATCLATALLLGLVPHASIAKTVTIGSGSGYIGYFDAQNTLELVPGDIVYIEAGTYSGIGLANITGTAAAPIIVRCDRNAVFTTDGGGVGNTMSNLAFVRFENFRFENYASRVMGFSGPCHDITFTNFNLLNLKNWGFTIWDSTRVFDGTKASTYYNFKWENITAKNGIGGIIINPEPGSIGQLRTVLLDFEIVNSSFTEMGGTVFDLSKCFNVKISNCVFTNMGTSLHNAMIGLKGYGQIFNNRFSGAWGDDVRAFPTKLNALGYNGPDAVIKFYNNISSEKRKFAMYEHNGIPDSDIAISKGLLARTASEIYFNTLYRSKKMDYIAPLVDVLFPNLTIKHNLIIQPECDAPFDPKRNYVYQVTSYTGNLVAENNYVFESFEDTGLLDATNFMPSTSSAIGDAATGRVPYITTDINGKPRYVGTAADVGAVEQQTPRTAGAPVAIKNKSESGTVFRHRTSATPE